MIPLARIIPRVLSKFRKRDNTFQTVQENQYQSGFEEQPRREYQGEYQKEEPKHEAKDMLVLGEINIGTKTFEGIQKKTQLDNEELDHDIRGFGEKRSLKGTTKTKIVRSKSRIVANRRRF